MSYHLFVCLLSYWLAEPFHCLDGMASEKFPVRERATKQMAAYGNTAAVALWSGKVHSDAEVRARCRQVEFLRTIAKQEKLISAFPKPEDYPFLDSLWYDTNRKSYIGTQNQWQEFIRLRYIAPVLYTNGGLEEEFRQLSSNGGYRQASKYLAIDLVSIGVPPVAIKAVFAELHRRDKVYLSTTMQAPVNVAAQPLPEGPP